MQAANLQQHQQLFAASNEALHHIYRHMHKVVDEAKTKPAVRTAMTSLCDEHRFFCSLGLYVCRDRPRQHPLPGRPREGKKEEGDFLPGLRRLKLGDEFPLHV